MNDDFGDRTVSVIIPVFNSHLHISDTLQSVLDQTYKDIEIVVVDDCSSDNSVSIIKKYQENYSNIVLCMQSVNSGVAAARNKAIQLSRGRYIAFLDSDDLWKADKIEKQLKCLEQTESGFCFSAIEMISESGEIVKGKRAIKEEIDYGFLLRNTMIATSSVILDRTKFQNISMPLIRSGQDYATWLRLLRDGRIAFGINEVLVSYRRTKNSLSSKKTRNFKKVFNIQVEHEGLDKFTASINCLWYIINSLKKYYF